MIRIISFAAVATTLCVALSAPVRAGDVDITEFTVARTPATVGGQDSIFLSGKLKNIGTKLLGQIQYNFTQWDGKAFVLIKGVFRPSGTVNSSGWVTIQSLNPGEVVPVWAWIPNSDSQQQFGLNFQRMGPTGHSVVDFGSKAFTLAARVPPKPPRPARGSR
jgi:hypothetical protein